MLLDVLEFQMYFMVLSGSPPMRCGSKGTYFILGQLEKEEHLVIGVKQHYGLGTRQPLWKKLMGGSKVQQGWVRISRN